MQITNFFNQLLNLDKNWRVVSLDYEQQDSKIIINVEYVSKKGRHPSSDTMLNIYDYAPVRQWRHLDILRYKTYIRARLPSKR